MNSSWPFFIKLCAGTEMCHDTFKYCVDGHYDNINKSQTEYNQHKVSVFDPRFIYVFRFTASWTNIHQLSYIMHVADDMVYGNQSYLKIVLILHNFAIILPYTKEYPIADSPAQNCT